MNDDQQTSHERAHAHPDYQTLEAILASEGAACAEMTMEQFQVFVGRTIDFDALHHYSGHRALDFLEDLMPPPLVMIFHAALNGLWSDGFMHGVRFQKMRADQLASTVIPDNIDGLT